MSVCAAAPAPENPLKRSAPAPEPQESRYPLRKRRKTQYPDHYSYISDSDFTDDDMVLNPDEEAEDEADPNEESTSHGEDDESTSHDEDDDSTIVPDDDVSEHTCSASSLEAADNGSEVESVEGWVSQAADSDEEMQIKEEETTWIGILIGGLR